jgi:ADP-heptose:LPS heptosyltransferase
MWRDAIRPLGRAWQRLVLETLRVGCRAALAVRPLPQAHGTLASPRSVAVFSTAGIGDTLSDTPAIRALRESFPAGRVTVVVHQRRREVLADNPHIHELVPHRKGVVWFFRTLRALRRARPEVAVVLRANDPDTWPLAYLSGAHSLVGRPANTKFGFLINRPVPVPEWDHLHGVEATLALVKELGAETADPRLVFRVSPAARQRIQTFLAARGLDGASLVAMQVHTSPRLTFRDWPVASFVALGRAILRDYPVSLVLTGGTEDRAKAVAIQAALGARASCVAGDLRLSETAALLERCRALLTTDTGVMHLGFAVGVPTLALLHPFNAHRVGPYGYGGRHRAVQLEGSACGANGQVRSLEELPPPAVYAAFREFVPRETA